MSRFGVIQQVHQLIWLDINTVFCKVRNKLNRVISAAAYLLKFTSFQIQLWIAEAHPGEGFRRWKFLPFGSKSSGTSGWHCQPSGSY